MRILLLSIICGLAAQAQTTQHPSWNAKAAAAYLDGRMDWWTTWPQAQRDHETFCVSCHTSLPYALARPALGRTLSESEPSRPQRKMLDNLVKRVSMWQDVLPFYSDAKNGAPKTAEARATEAIMNALILARSGAPEAKDAMRNMWALQYPSGEKAGGFIWLNFHNEPWEADDSGFWGASLAALAAGAAPSAEFDSNVTLLGGFLQREQETQSVLHRATALWASGKLPKLLTADQRAAIAQDIISQQRDDGGWSESSIVIKGWKRKDGTQMDETSDGYATGLMVLALREGGPASAKAPAAKGIAWLERNQDASGVWPTSSMNKKRDPASDPGRFMTDAATAYASLALSGK
jgi:squalene-hopene/tetraprenyl-beta-curcumene cyclase